MLRRVIQLAASVAGICLLPTLVFAQAGIAGNVKDSSGAVLPGVTVEAASPALIEKTRSVVTDGAGNYKIENLRPGTYSVTFTLPGFNTVKRDGIELAGSFVAAVNADLKVGAIEETITVTGQTPIVDIQSTARQRVLSNDIIESVPTARSYSALGVLLPGVNNSALEVGSSAGSMNSLSSHGSSGGDQRILQNGLNVSTLQVGTGNISGMIPNQSGAQEVAIDTGGFAAERQTGGVAVNYIQRDGGNTFKSYNFVTYAGSGMAGSNLTGRVQTGQYTNDPNVTNATGLLAVNTIKENWEINPSFGGPIQKDRIWFYYSARYQRAQNYAAGMYQNANGFTSLGTPSNFQYVPVPAAQGLATDGKWDDSQIRVTWQASAKNKFTGMWDTQSYCQCPNAITATASPQSAPDRRFPNQNFLHFEYFSPITSKILIEFVGLHRQERWGNMELRPSDTSPMWPSFGGSFDRYFPLSEYPAYLSSVGVTENGTINAQQANLTYGGPGVTGGTGPFNNNWVPSYHYRAAVSYVTGSHSFKVGYQEAVGYIQSSQYALPGPFTGGVPLRYIFNSTPQPAAGCPAATTSAMLPAYNASGTATGGVNCIIPFQIQEFATPFTFTNNQNHDFGLFFQDKWTMKRMTLNYGVRYDWFKSEFPDQPLAAATIFAGSGLPRATNQQLPGMGNLDWQDISPRFGVAYDLFGDGKTAIKGTVNKYVGGATGNLLVTANPVSALVNSTTRSWTDTNHDFIPQCDYTSTAKNGECGAITGVGAAWGTLTSTATNSSDLLTGWNKRSYNWEFSAGVQQQLLPRVGLEVSYFRRIYGNFTLTENLAYDGRNGCGTPTDHSGCFNQFSMTAPTDPRLGSVSGSTVSGLYDPTVAAAGFTPVNQTVLAKDLPGSPSMYQHWNGVDVSVNARLSNGILLQGGTSTGRVHGDYCQVAQLFPEILGSTSVPGQTGNTATNATPLANCAITAPFLTSGKLLAIYTVPKIGVQVSGAFQTIPGSVPLQAVATISNSANVAIGQIPVGSTTLNRALTQAGGTKPVNLLPGSTDQYLERVNQIDMRFAKILRYGRTRTNVSLDLYNATNTDTITAINTTYASLWRPSNLLQARYVKVSAQFDF